MILQKVISGGQTGADQAGIVAAKVCGLSTGGYAPRDFLTEEGPCPWLGGIYGLVQCVDDTQPADTYRYQTRRNVDASDATIRFARNFNSPGTCLTRKLCIELGKPYWDVVVGDTPYSPEPKETAQWIIDNNIQTLNVAGNRESVCPGIKIGAALYLSLVFFYLERYADAHPA